MKSLTFNRATACKRPVQLAVVLLGAFALKLFYSNASANQLRGILAPTTALVELVSGRSFAFEAHAGYLSGDHTFLIAASCAGVNFLIAAFLMLTLRRLWRDRSPNTTAGQGRGGGWNFIPLAALVAYLATLVANTARISIALWLQRRPLGIGWLNAAQLHRFEGIVVYFGFLLLLFWVSEKVLSIQSSVNQESPSGLPADAGRSPGRPGPLPHTDRVRSLPALFRGTFFPLAIYYLTALAIPIANSIFHRGDATTDFREHSLFVLLTPLGLILLLAMIRLKKFASQRIIP